MAVLGLDLRIGSSHLVSERPSSSHGGSRHVAELSKVDSLEGRILHKIGEIKLEFDSWKERVLRKMDEFAEEARLQQLRSQSRREELQRLKDALATRFEIPSIVDEAMPQDQDREVGESCNEVLRNEPVARRERRREEPQLHRQRQVERQRNSISVADPVDSTAAHQVFVDLPQLDLVFEGEDEVIHPHVEDPHPQEWRPRTSAKLCQSLAEVVDLVAEQATLKLQPSSLWPSTRGSTSSLFFKALEARAEAEEFDALRKLVRKRLVFDPGGTKDFHCSTLRTRSI